MPNLRLDLLLTVAVLFIGLLLAACGGGSPGSSAAPGSPSADSRSSVQHVVLVVLENHDYLTVVGSPAMPFLNELIARGALATNYFANMHPSLPDYFMMTTGQLITTDNAFHDVVTADNLARQLTSTGKTWRVYAQSLPSTGYLGFDVYPYVRHHVPFAFFSDVQSDPVQQQNIVPLSQLSSDIAANALPTFAMIVPDQQHNGHDCPSGAQPAACAQTQRMVIADGFIRDVVEPLLSVPNTLVIVTFDESASDNRNGGGQIATVLVGTGVKVGFQSTTFYQHQSLYRLILEMSGVSTLPPEAASAPSMGEFFN